IRSCYNYMGWVSSSNILSSFYFVIWLFTILTFFNKKIALPNQPLKIVAVAFLLYPIAFWLMTFDNGRYLWITVPLCAILLMYYAATYLFPLISNWSRKIFIALFF